jgi:hypothetical protein
MTACKFVRNPPRSNPIRSSRNAFPLSNLNQGQFDPKQLCPLRSSRRKIRQVKSSFLTTFPASRTCGKVRPKSSVEQPD